MSKIGVFVARMQPLHNSHIFLIEQSMKENDKTYVFISSADKNRTERNPFTIEERLGMFRKVYSEELQKGKLFVIPLNDLTDEDDQDVISWGDYLYQNIVNEIQEDEFNIYYSDEPEIILSWFRDEIKDKINFRLFNRKELFAELSATKIRKALLENDINYLSEMLPYEIFVIREELANILQIISETI